MSMKGLFTILLGTRAKPPGTLAEHEAQVAKSQTALAAASAHLEQCRREVAAAILDRSAGGPESAVTRTRQKYKDAVEAEELARIKLEGAEAVHAKAMEADQAEKRKAQVAKIAEHLAARNAAAEALSAAIGEACRQWQALLQHCDAAANVGIPLPMGAMVRTDELQHALADEMYRLGANPTNIGKSFPGGHPSDLMMRDQPEAIPALPDTVKHANAFILATLSGDIGHASQAVPSGDSPQAISGVTQS